MRRPTLSRALGSFALSVAVLQPAYAALPTERPASFMRGVIVSCPRAGQIWGTEEMSSALEEIASLGAQWVALHPYAWVAHNGTIRFRPATDTDYLDAAVERMRRAGLQILWKPHLGYWGSFEWRGAIEFGGDETAWRRFFAGYRDFIVDQARFAEEHGIPILGVGVEYEATMEHEAEWRSVIEAVREVYSGRLFYAANWDGLAKVRFWDALDIVGVHAYFPLSADDDPERGALLAGWDQHLDELRRLSRQTGKPVLLAEIGYNRSSRAASHPWEHGSEDSPEHRRLRRDLMEVALERIEREPEILGMFWWKWMPGPGRGRDFSLKDAEAREALSRYWLSPPRSRPRAAE